MRLTKKKLTLGAALAIVLVAGFLLTPAQESEALAQLTGWWQCGCGQCTIFVTSNNHASYKFNFGDGSGLTSNNYHSYAPPPAPAWMSWNASIIGYTSGGSIDNIIGCNILYYDTGGCVGGAPPYTGTCG